MQHINKMKLRNIITGRGKGVSLKLNIVILYKKINNKSCSVSLYNTYRLYIITNTDLHLISSLQKEPVHPLILNNCQVS